MTIANPHDRLIAARKKELRTDRNLRTGIVECICAANHLDGTHVNNRHFPVVDENRGDAGTGTSLKRGEGEGIGAILAVNPPGAALENQLSKHLAILPAGVKTSTVHEQNLGRSAVSGKHLTAADDCKLLEIGEVRDLPVDRYVVKDERTAAGARKLGIVVVDLERVALRRSGRAEDVLADGRDRKAVEGDTLRKLDARIGIADDDARPFARNARGTRVRGGPHRGIVP